MENQRNFEKVEPNVWKPENAGDRIEGTLIRKSTGVGVNESNTYHLEKDDRSQWMLWGSTILDGRMDFINEGDYVRITYDGVKKNSRNQDTKQYTVEKEKIPGVTEETVK